MKTQKCACLVSRVPLSVHFSPFPLPQLPRGPPPPPQLRSLQPTTYLPLLFTSKNAQFLINLCICASIYGRLLLLRSLSLPPFLPRPNSSRMGCRGGRGDGNGKRRREEEEKTANNHVWRSHRGTHRRRGMSWKGEVGVSLHLALLFSCFHMEIKGPYPSNKKKK